MDLKVHQQTKMDGANRFASEPNIKPEWIRIPNAVRISGICRSAIYELINSGAIKSFSHRKRGCALGQRLISYDSLVAYLNGAYEAASRVIKAQAGESEGRSHE
jgi:hypothetical protein